MLGMLVLLGCLSRGQAASLRVPRDYPSIQAGLAAARTGDTVLVAPGVYYENLVMKPGVHIHGEPGAILDGSQTPGAVVSAWNGVEHTAVLSGFVIRRGRQAGILLNQAAPTIRNNVIVKHIGPGITCLQASPRIVNNIITHNAGGGIVCKYPGTTPMIVYNDLWQNQPADYLGCTPGAGNRHEDPRFVNAQQDDYRLQDESLLIDAGHPDATFNDVDGSHSDMGIYGGPQPARTRRHRVATTPELLRNSLSFQGLPGIIDVPTATTVPPGSVDMGYNLKRDFNVFPSVVEQKNFTFAIGLLPRVTIGGRGTVANPEVGPFLARDILANLQVLLLEEGWWWPAVAVGLQDIGGGAQLFKSNYLVLSKSLFGRLRGTIGAGTGPDTLDGPFAGVELALNRFLTLMGEYDTDDFNAGLRLFPLPQKLEAYGIPRLTLDLVWQDGEEFVWGVSLRSGLGEAKFRAQRAAHVHKRYRRWTPPAGQELSFQAVSEQLQAALVQRGLENVRVAMLRSSHGYTVVVEYENRRYNRDELHGLGLVLGLTATHTPPEVTHARIIVKEVNIPVLQFSTAVDDYLAFLNEQMSAQVFAAKIQMVQHAHKPEREKLEATTAIGNRSWLKLDVLLRPAIATRLLSETGVADMSFSILPDAFMQLTPGMVVNIRANIPVTQTPGFFPDSQGSPRIDRLLLHQALRLPLGKWSRFVAGLTQFSVGRFNLTQFGIGSRNFEEEEVGIANETVLTFLNGLAFFKGTLARLGTSPTNLDRWVVLGNGRIRYPPLALNFGITGGRFRDGDHGITVDVRRFFGNTEIGVFLRHSGRGSLGGIRFGIPLTPAKELKPMVLRPRLPDFFDYAQFTTLFTDANIIRSDIGRRLGTGHEIERVYWNRDRLYPVHIRHHVNTLKHATRRWVDE